MLEEIEPWQFTEWEAMYRLKPWGDDWLQTATIEAAIRNKDNPEPVHPLELIPNEDNRQPEPDAAALHASARSMAGL